MHSWLKFVNVFINTRLLAWPKFAFTVARKMKRRLTVDSENSPENEYKNRFE